MDTQAASGRRTRLDAPAVRLDDRPADRQPQTGASTRPAARGLDAIEAIEQARQCILRHPRPGIADAQPHRIAGRPGRNTDRPGDVRVLQGVGQQIAEHLLDALTVDLGPQLRIVALGTQRESGFLETRPEPRDRRVDHLA